MLYWASKSQQPFALNKIDRIISSLPHPTQWTNITKFVRANTAQHNTNMLGCIEQVRAPVPNDSFHFSSAQINWYLTAVSLLGHYAMDNTLGNTIFFHWSHTDGTDLNLEGGAIPTKVRALHHQIIPTVTMMLRYHRIINNTIYIGKAERENMQD
jgi:hypothetical protein